MTKYISYIKDIGILAAKFAGSLASLSTPHLYMSTLAAYDRKSILYQTWSSTLR